MAIKVRSGGALAALVAALAVAFVPCPVHAQAPAEAIPAPRFDINRFDVVGNTLLPAERVTALVGPYTGKNKDFADIQRALEALEQEYRNLGYGVVQVLLPEQDITKGVVQFRVLQPKVGRVLIEGNTRFDADNIRASLPTVKEGTTPNSKDIARNLQVTAEHPVKQTNVLLRSGASEDQLDVNVKVVDDKPWRAFFTADNTGTSSTGYARTGIGLQHTNLFNRDHQLTAHYVTSPTEASRVAIYGMGYRVPFYGLNSAFDFVAGYSDVDSGTVQGLFNVAGSGTIGSLRWTYFMPKWGETEQKVAFAFDHRAFENKVTDTTGAGNFVPDITLHPLSLNYTAARQMAASNVSIYGGVSHNIPFGSNGKKEDFECPRVSDGLCVRNGASADYTILRYGFNYVLQFFGDWQTRLAFNGQWTDDLLIPGEQFGIGGPDSVRGYLLREVASDKGSVGQAELYTPDFARIFKWSDSYRVRLLAFYDYGSVQRNSPEKDGGIPSDWLASAGIGIRIGYGKSLSVRVDAAQVFKATPNREKDSQHVNAAIAIVY